MKFWESGDIIHLVIDMKIINRKYYIDKLIALKNKPDIKNINYYIYFINIINSIDNYSDLVFQS